MKRKTLALALACCAIIPCTLAITACGDSGETISVSSEAELRTAIEEASANDIIKLNENIDLTTKITIENKVKINLNEKSLTAVNDTAGDGIFYVVKGGELTIEGEGIVNGVGNNTWNIGIFANGGRVIINGGTFTNVGAKDDGPDGDHFDLIYVKNGGSVVINDGKFICETPAWTLNLHDGTRDISSIEVKGGSFKEFNPANNSAEGPETNFVVDGYKVEEALISDSTWYTVIAE